MLGPQLVALQNFMEPLGVETLLKHVLCWGLSDGMSWRTSCPLSAFRILMQRGGPASQKEHGARRMQETCVRLVMRVKTLKDS